MSQYYNFRRCAVHRSKILYNEYKRCCDAIYNVDLDVTHLLSMLYLTVIHLFEARGRGGDKICSTGVVDLLNKRGVMICTNSELDNFQIFAALRNGLAHLNIETENDSCGNISIVRIKSNKEIHEPICQVPCELKRCVDKNRRIDRNVIICTFIFSVEQLKGFYEDFVEYALERMDKKQYPCSVSCKYYEK